VRLPPSCPTSESFAAALESASRTLSGAAGFELDAAVLEPVAKPPAGKAPADCAVVRGRCDAEAMKVRFHDAVLHRAMCPAGPVSMAMFEALESLRVETCAAGWRCGVAVNLAALFEHERSLRGNNVLQTDAPAALPNAVVLAVRACLLDEPPAAEAARLLARWRDELDRCCGPLLTSLAANVADQRTFGRRALELIGNLELNDDPQRGQQARAAEVPPAEPIPENGAGTDAGGQDAADADGPQAVGDESAEVGGGEGENVTGRGDGDPEPNTGATVVPFPQAGHDGPDQADGDVRDGDPEQPGSDDTGKKAAGYRVWTTRFDEVVHARDLLGRQQLEALRGQLELELAKHRRSAVKLASRLQNSLKTLQKRSWTFDLDDGLLDTTRLARLVTDPLSPLVYKQERDSASRDTVVSFLVDNSGSMRGRPIALAAMFVDILCHALERCQVATEILGFTTRHWRGGQTRQQWRDAGKPLRPGRLSDLRHVVYKGAGEPWRRARQTLGGMLWPQLLKENIDGEALLWAHGRLAGRPEQRRILIMICDGVPADDSTLTANSQDYLATHLRRVVEWIESRSSVELVAVGIGHDVGGFYRRSTTIADAEQLGDAIAHQIIELLANVPAAVRKPYPLSSLAG